jgi:hypothetical protein
MIGVCPVNMAVTSRLCRTSAGKLKRIIDYFEAVGKLQSSNKNQPYCREKPLYIWWKSKLYHSLSRGNYSKTQLIAAENRINKWHLSRVFDEKWADGLVQLYATKYSLVIPYTEKRIEKQNPKRCSYTESEDLTLNTESEDLTLNTESEDLTLNTEKEKPACKKPEPDERIEKIFELFKTNCPSLPTPELTETRKGKIKRRLKEHPDLPWWEKIFQDVEASDWLAGRVKEWNADFDWIIKPENLQKVIEGNYKNKPKKDGQDGGASSRVQGKHEPGCREF